MKVACLQFNPALGAVQQNIDKANGFLQSMRPSQVDLLVLPEMAFSGYNFPDLTSIQPYLEPTSAGATTQWAIETAKRLNCIVTVGYPEIYAGSSDSTEDVGPKYYNSTVTVSPTGQILLNYRKSFLYYTDETWASEGPNGSAQRLAPHDVFKPFFCGQLGKLGRVGHGICMDINPYQFTAPWTEYEFAATMLREGIKVVVLSMAWLTSLLPRELETDPDQPDMQTVAYWLERFFPFFTADEPITVVFANRCGAEGNSMSRSEPIGVDEGQDAGNRVYYAGSSCVMRFQNGEVSLFERILGKGEEGVLVVDTSQKPKFALQTSVA